MSLLVNGRRFSHASLEITLQGVKGSAEIFIDVQEVSYGDSLEIVFVYGTNQAPLGATKGKYEPADAVLKMSKSAIQKVIEKIGDGWLGSSLQVVIKYSDEGEKQIVDSFVGPITKLDDSSSDGPDPIQPSITLKPFYVLRNKIKPLKNHFGL